MDFSYSDDQAAISELAKQILEDGCDKDRLRAIERAGGDRFDPELWKALAGAGLVGVAIPEPLGGGEQGFLEIAVILEQVGRTAAPIPLLETAVLGALPLAEFGSDDLQQRILPSVADGSLILTAALVEDQGVPTRPETTAIPRGALQDGAFTLHGVKLFVPAGQLAGRILVPATTPDGEVGVFLVDTSAAGVTLEPMVTTSGQPEAVLQLDGVTVDAADVVGAVGQGTAIVDWINQRATAALCCIALGVCEEALRLTAEFTKTRKQFDQPIAMFQAVGHRAAEAFIDTEGIRLTAQQAAWRIHEGLDAEPQIAVAKFWAAEGGSRVVRAAQHLHGGVGVDRDYPLHRFYLYARQIELTLGGSSHQLRRLGALIASGAA